MFGAITAARASSSMVKVMVLTSLFFEIKSGFFEDTLESHYGIASSLFVFRTPAPPWRLAASHLCHPRHRPMRD